MRTLISHSSTTNTIRLALLEDTRYQWQVHMTNFPNHPALLCVKLVKAADRVKDKQPAALRKQIDLEAYNLRAYLAQELADGHSPDKTRNMHAYLYWAGLLASREITAQHTLIANLARGAWLDRMIETLAATIKEIHHA